MISEKQQKLKRSLLKTFAYTKKFETPELTQTLIDQYINNFYHSLYYALQQALHQEKIPNSVSAYGYIIKENNWSNEGHDKLLTKLSILLKEEILSLDIPFITDLKKSNYNFIFSVEDLKRYCQVEQLQSLL